MASNASATASATPLDAKAPQRRKKEYSSSNEEAHALQTGEVIDLQGIVFKEGRRLLDRAGKTDRQSGSIIGGWLKKTQPAILLEAFQEASRADRDDVVAYIGACLRQRKPDGAPSNPAVGTPEHEEAKRKWGYDA